MNQEAFLILTIVLALSFDVINGFHDAANSIATVVSTRVLRPQTAVLWAAFFNFSAFLIFAPKVAETVSKIVRIESIDIAYTQVIFSALLGAIFWDILTWWFGLPTSSSHALIGGLAGAGFAQGGMDAIRWNILVETSVFIVIAPALGFLVGGFLMCVSLWVFKKQRPMKIDAIFRFGQLISAALYSLGHGANDAQKTMGMILALLIAQGIIPAGTPLSLSHPKTSWVILSCQMAMAIGTAFGGWRIIKTMGMKLTKLKPLGGFCAETAGSLTLFFATFMGIPVSTTHTITGAIVGVGSLTTKVSAVRWGVAKSIVWAWILTLPFSAFLGAICFFILRWQF